MDNSASTTDSIWSAVALLGVAAGLLLDPGVAVAADSPIISSFADLSLLSSNKLAQHLSFETHGIVLCYDAAWNQFYLSTETETVYLSPQLLHADLHPGDLVRISGVTIPTNDKPPLTNLTTLVLGRSTLPPAKPTALPDLATTTGSWIQFTAPVRVAETSRGRLGLSVGSSSRSCVVYVMGPPPTNDTKSFVGALARIRAINTSHTLNGRITETFLVVPDATQITILQPPASPLGALPVVSIDALFNRELGPWTNEPVHLNGEVLSAVPGDSLLLRDPTGIIRARVVQVTAVTPGTRVDLWGYLDTSPDQPVLAEGYFETAAAALPPSLQGQVSTNQLSKTVSSLAELRSLPRDQITQGIPVKVHGVVIYSDPEWRTAFVHDGTTAVYAELNQTNIEIGQRVELSGRARLGAFGPAVLPARFQVLGATNLPIAVPADLDDVADGHLDAQWVEMRGVVRRANAEWNHLRLSVMSRQGKFEVVVPGFKSNRVPDGLLDSRVSILGVCGSDLNTRGQLSGISLYAPSLRSVKTLEAAPADPFAIPATPIAAVATFDPERIAGRRVKVAGTVTLDIPGREIYLQDASGGIRIQTRLADVLKLLPGDSIEVLGFPALGEFSPHLEEPILRRLTAGPLPQPLATTAEQILLRGTNDASLVRLEALLLQHVPRSAQPKLILQQGPVIFSAQLAAGRLPEVVSSWRPGSLLRLTGVCSIQGADTRNAQSFRLLLANPGQLELLKAPPAWTFRELLLFACGLGFLGLLTLSWIIALRRQVRARTAELRASQASLQRQADHSHALSELGRRLNAAATPKDAALIIVEVADRLIGWDCCICDMYSSESNVMTHVLNIDLLDGHRVEYQPQFIQLPPSALARRAIDAGPQLFLRQPAELAQAEGIPFGDTARRSASILYVPICNGTDTIGVLSIQSYAFNAYDEQDLAVLQALADHCSGALDRIRSHQQLVEISRQAGMAEVATAVLHNVGNVLNSVNVTVSLLRERVKDSYAAKLAKVSELLSAHKHDLPDFLTRDPKGQKLPDYLAQFAAVVASAETHSRSELESLALNVDHIKEIVAMQQSFARVAGVAETLPAAELVEDALRLNAGALSRHQVEVCRDYPPQLPTLTVDKHKVLQILINLIRNAKYACDESGRPDKRITVRVANGDDRLRISVADNGTGIPPENLTRIFGLGFSTRKEGHGFGLHSGALAAKELGGALTVHSDGPGRGATFTLELPLSASN